MAVENLYQKIAQTLWLVFGLVSLGACLMLVKADVAAYRSMQPVQVIVQELHIATENTAVEDVGQVVQVHTEMMLSTPQGLRLVWESVLLKPDAAGKRVAELEALRGRNVTMYLSAEAPHSFAFTRSFPARWLIALGFVLLLFVLPPTLAIWMRSSESGKPQAECRCSPPSVQSSRPPL